MNKQEEELQRKAEKGGFSVDTGENQDLKAYKLVFDAVKKPQDMRLSPGFADRVVARVEARQKKASVMDVVWFIFGALALTIGCVVAIVKTQFKIDFGFLAGMSAYTGVFIFGVAFIIVLNIIDRRLKKSFREFDGLRRTN